MSNLGDMKAYVAKRLIDPSNTAVSGDDITEAINNAIRYWKFRRFWFNEVNDTATLTTGSSDFPYPTDFLVPVIKDGGFVVNYGGVNWPLAKLDMPNFDAVYLDNGYGLPRWYARNGDLEYKCYPIPNSDYTVRRHYLKDYVALSADADTNDFTDNAARLIQLWALADLWAELRQDQDSSKYYREACKDEYRQLQVMTDKANSAGKVTLYSPLVSTLY